MSEVKDRLLKDMMMDSKHTMHDPAFRDVIMNNIMKRDKKRSIWKNMVFYFIPVLLTVILLLLFGRPMVRQLNTITIDLTAETILQSLSDMTNYIRLIIIFIVLVIVQKLLPARVHTKTG